MYDAGAETAVQLSYNATESGQFILDLKFFAVLPIVKI